MRDATTSDYEKYQGGMPEVQKNGRSFLVVHNYPRGNGAIVATTAGQLTETVNLPIGEETIRFQAALLWAFHGRPCETLSKSIGGEGYKRVQTS